MTIDLQTKMHAEMAVRQRQMDARRAAEVELAQRTLAELERQHPDLLERREAAREALHAAASDVQDAQHRAQQHASAPPQDREQVAAWVRRRTDLAGEVEAFNHLHQQTQAAYEQATQVLRATVQGEVRKRYYTQARACNAERQAAGQEYKKRLEALQAWEKEQGERLAHQEQEQLLPLYRVATELLGVALPFDRDQIGLIRLGE